MSVHVCSGVEGVMGGGDITCQDGGVEFGVGPPSGLHSLGEFCAVDADLPGEQAVRFEFGPADLGDGGFVAARKQFEREAAVLVEINELILAFGRSFFDGDERIVHMLEKNGTVGVEESPKIGRQSVNGAVDDEFVGVVAPGGGGNWPKQNRRGDADEDESLESSKHSER